MKSKIAKIKNADVDAILTKMETKGQLKNTAIKTLTSVGLFVIGGKLASAILGRPSFYIGLGLTGLGYYNKNSWIPAIGLGMMASSNPLNKSTSTVEGFDFKSELSEAKERVKGLKDDFLHNTYLDKFFDKKEPEGGVTGFGNPPVNFGMLDKLEQQIISSAMEYQQNAGSNLSNVPITEYDIDLSTI